ncbi:formin-like protein 17 [Canna indica]|uniref:Formin-like protein n=1 Tax=Canna indica TaxID=4628 RepID=A0AAQ3KH08_9LILI|nr:formin-like protein 17 [Canna indica]
MDLSEKSFYDHKRPPGELLEICPREYDFFSGVNATSSVTLGLPRNEEKISLQVHIHQDTSADASGQNSNKIKQNIQIDKILQSSELQYGEDVRSVSKSSVGKGASAATSNISTTAVSGLHKLTAHILTPELLQESPHLELRSSKNILVNPSPSPYPAQSVCTSIIDSIPPSSLPPMRSSPAPSPLVLQPVIPEISSLLSLQPSRAATSESLTMPSPVLEISPQFVSPYSAKQNPPNVDTQHLDNTSVSTPQSSSTMPDILITCAPTSLSIKKAACLEGSLPSSLSPSCSGPTLPNVHSASTLPLSSHHARVQATLGSSPGSLPRRPTPPPTHSSIGTAQNGKPSATSPPPGSLPLPTVKPSTQSSQRTVQTGKPSAPPPPLPPGLGNRTSSRRIPLRPFYWTKVTRAMKGSLWEEAKKYKEVLKVPEVDTSELERLFYVPPNTERHQSVGGKSKKVHLIPFQRAQVYEMLLKGNTIPNFMNALLAFDDSLLGVKAEVDFTKLYPKDDECKLLQRYNGDKESLGMCEQFLLELMKIPEAKSKLRALSVKIRFHTKVLDVRNDLNTVNSAASEIISSSKLKIIMLVVLSLGNALNQGTSRGSAIGFKLDSLLKLTDTRASNKKMTLMHYLCKVLADNFPVAFDLDKDLVSLESASKIDPKVLADDIEEICKGLEDVEHEMKSPQADGSEMFFKNLEEFLVIARAEVSSLTSLHSEVLRNVDAMAIYFGEDPARCQRKEVLSKLFEFTRMLQRAARENCQRVEMERNQSLKKTQLKDKIVLPRKKNESSDSLQGPLTKV